MNAAFTALVLLSLSLMTVVHPADALPTMISGVANAITLSLKLTAIYAVWLSVLKMMEATGLDKKLSRGLRPVIRRLFKGEKDETYDHIAVNLSADMLGMGGVATAAGIKAMASMCPADGRATDNMLLLLVLNATSVQIIPATVIALRAAGGSSRAAGGSSNAASVLLPTLISTTVATVTGGLLCKVFAAKDRHRPAAATCPPTPPRNDRRRSSARRPRKSAAIRRQCALATKDGTTP